jgi:glycosyltransferase involved in cell wall biosynthesis
VVSTDAGGVRYLVEQDRSGYVVPVGDDKALSEALLNVITNRDKRERMGQRARELAEKRFRASVVAEQTCEVYHAIATTYS